MSEYIEIKGRIPHKKILQEIVTEYYRIFPQPDQLKWTVSSSLKNFEYRACSKPILLPAHKKKLADQEFVVRSKENQIGNYVDAFKCAFDNREFLDAAVKIAPVIVKRNYDWLSQLQIILIQYYRALYIAC